jgi:hypothetical protein
MSHHFRCPSRHNVVSLSRASRHNFLSRRLAEFYSPKCPFFYELRVLLGPMHMGKFWLTIVVMDALRYVDHVPPLLHGSFCAAEEATMTMSDAWVAE